MHTLTVTLCGRPSATAEAVRFLPPCGRIFDFAEGGFLLLCWFPDVHASTILVHAKPLRACTRGPLHVFVVLGPSSDNSLRTSNFGFYPEGPPCDI